MRRKVPQLVSLAEVLVVLVKIAAFDGELGFHLEKKKERKRVAVH
jgi:hypothetical protein